MSRHDAIEGAIKDAIGDATGDPVSETVASLIAPTVEAAGFSLVRIRFDGRQGVLQIMVERRDGAAVSVEDCAHLSESLSALLDAEDPIPGAYSLEVSSPGLDRPLTRRQDFERFAGFEARVEMRLPIEGRKRFHGTLLGLSGDYARLAMAEGETALPLKEIHKAKLVINDKLLATASHD